MKCKNLTTLYFHLLFYSLCYYCHISYLLCLIYASQYILIILSLVITYLLKKLRGGKKDGVLHLLTFLHSSFIPAHLNFHLVSFFFQPNNYPVAYLEWRSASNKFS